jgi:hypothetical protein
MLKMFRRRPVPAVPAVPAAPAAQTLPAPDGQGPGEGS